MYIIQNSLINILVFFNNCIPIKKLSYKFYNRIIYILKFKK